jgi:hypothetical protein
MRRLHSINQSRESSVNTEQYITETAFSHSSTNVKWYFDAGKLLTTNPTKKTSKKKNWLANQPLKTSMLLVFKSTHFSFPHVIQ